MPNCSRNDVILVRYPFCDLSGAKVRPAVVVSAPHVSQDVTERDASDMGQALRSWLGFGEARE